MGFFDDKVSANLLQKAAEKGNMHQRTLHLIIIGTKVQLNGQVRVIGNWLIILPMNYIPAE